jgi:branched-chain amino acid transport system substrate-binding protein
MRPTHRSIAVLAIAAVLAAACSSDGTDSVTPTERPALTTTTTTAPAWPSDGVLSIGVLLPITGPLSSIGEPMVAAIKYAVDLINDAGGVLGQPVELVVADEGSSVASAIIGYDTLLTTDVDAIIGPLSSASALGGLSRSINAGVLNCSPSASAASLDGFPSNGLLFRTIPSDSLQAVAIARQVEQTGGSRVAIMAVDDTFGRPYAKKVADEVTSRGLEVVYRTYFRSTDDDLDDKARSALDQQPDVLVVLGNTESLNELIDALTAVERPASFPQVITNDALRNLSESTSRALPASVRTRLSGVAPVLGGSPEDSDPDVMGRPFASHGFDCATLIALATERAGVDDPARIAAQVPEVSSGGALCRNFASCRARLAEGLQIDYSGRSGAIDFEGRPGQVTRARFEQFVFDPSGQSEVTSTFDVSAR